MGSERPVSQAPEFQDAGGVTCVVPAVTERQLQTGPWLSRSLVHTLDGWSVVESLVVPTETPDSRLVFGQGNLEQLTEELRGSPEVTFVFLNVERMSWPLQKELEAAWGVQVFDCFTIVLYILSCYACPREAWLQLTLAVIPLLKARASRGPQQGDKNPRLEAHIPLSPHPPPGAAGEMFLQVQQHLLKDREARIKETLQNLVTKRRRLCQQLQGRELPTVTVMGYTNCMKTSLIQALTGDTAAQPWDQLFATLDTKAYTGSLPSRLIVLYVDTIGFPSQLPNELVASFTATLVDVACELRTAPWRPAGQ
ncbi:putative GTP-binding protein 6 [Tenrec ecaudatus]|uniref:putative GTP-binding protein 6 n=1 Tax=Tenrec ecaudatus TaxID=94439 RepID=UPI003F5A625E